MLLIDNHSHLPTGNTKQFKFQVPETKHPDSLIKSKLLKIQNKSTSTTTKNNSGSIGNISKLSSKFLVISKAAPSSSHPFQGKKLKMNPHSFNNKNDATTSNTTLYTPRNQNNYNCNNDLSGEEYMNSNITNMNMNMHMNSGYIVNASGTNVNTIHVKSHRHKQGLSCEHKSSLHSSGNGLRKKSLIKNSYQPNVNNALVMNGNVVKNNYIMFNQFKNSAMFSPSLNSNPKRFNNLTETFNVNTTKANNSNYHSTLNVTKGFHNKTTFPSANLSRKYSKEKIHLKTDASKGLSFHGFNVNHSKPQSSKKLNKIEEIKMFSEKKDSLVNIFNAASSQKNGLIKMKVNTENIGHNGYSNSNSNSNKAGVSKGKKEHFVNKHISDICITSPTQKANNNNKVVLSSNNNNISSCKKNVVSPKTTVNCEDKYDCDLDNSCNRNDSLLQYINANISRNHHHNHINNNGIYTTETSNNSYSSVCSTSHPENFIHNKDKDIICSYIQSYYQKHKAYPSTKINFYKYGRLLGKGAFAKVILSLHVLTGRLVAIKTIPKKNLNTEHKRKKIEFETGILKTLSKSDYIVKLYEKYETQKHVCIVMEYICAGDLLTYIKKRNKLNESTAKYIFKQILLALNFIHSHNIIHRDIKLDNILIDLDNNIRVCDFGVSRQIDPKTDIMHEQCGTPAYMAPELLMGYGYTGFNADLWSAGVVLYAMLSGTVPFRGNNVKDVHLAIVRGEYQELKHVSKEAQDLLSGLLEIDPSLRYSAAKALKHPWLENVDVKNKEKYNLFTNAERVLLAKSNVDYRDLRNKDEMLERFNLRNIDTVEHDDVDKDGSGGENKSLILAPYNSSFSTWNEDENEECDDDNEYKSKKQECNDDELLRRKFEKKYKKEHIDLFNRELKIRNHYIKFKLKAKEQDRVYELNNNGEIDNGVVLQEMNSSRSKDDAVLLEKRKNLNLQFYDSSSDSNDNNDNNNNKHLHERNIEINKKHVKEVVSLGYSSSYVSECLKKNCFNYATASYYLIKKYSS